MENSNKDLEPIDVEYSNENKDLVVMEEDFPIYKSEYGWYVQRSTLCPLCQRSDHMVINAARARDHRSLQDISSEFGISKIVLKKHFTNHYQLSDSNLKIINLKEDDSQESREIITKALENNMDLVSGALSVNVSKAERLSFLKTIYSSLASRYEVGDLETDEKMEFYSLNKAIAEVEDSIIKVYEKIDKKIFSMKDGTLSDAVLSYKMSILSKVVDCVVRVFLEYEVLDEVLPISEVVKRIRTSLADEFNKLEDEVVKAGGLIKPLM